MLGLQTLGGTSGLAVVLGVIFAVIVLTVIVKEISTLFETVRTVFNL